MKYSKRNLHAISLRVVCLMLFSTFISGFTSCNPGFSIRIQSPKNGAKIESATTTVSGRLTWAEKLDAAYLEVKVNGIDAVVDASSKTFIAQNVPLQVGLNILKATAKYENTHFVADKNPRKPPKEVQVSLFDADYKFVRRVDVALPPDPATIAPKLSETKPASFSDRVSFLYGGEKPIQTGVEQAFMQPNNLTVVKGKVLSNAGAASGVRITVLGHPQYGQTLSRADGAYDFVVNAGRAYTLVFEREGIFPVQRRFETHADTFVSLDDVYVTELDAAVTSVAVGSSAPAQIARGSRVSDVDGERQGTLLIPAGIEASIVLPDGTRQSTSSLNVRVTEYTVGENGQKAMPAPLPPTSHYTYAVEFSADEAIGAGSDSVEFTQPLYYYVEDFIGFPVGSAVPVGFYDRRAGVWKAEENGRVVRVIGQSGGLATVDVNGSGNAASDAELLALGFTNTERQQLAQLYTSGTSLWRVPVKHFSPYDMNWALSAPGSNTRSFGIGTDSIAPYPTVVCGSIVEVEPQVLSEAIPVNGTPFSLVYRSDQVPGRATYRSLDIPLTGVSVPAELREIRVDVNVLGVEESSVFDAGPNIGWRYTWNGLDAYGREAGSGAIANVRIRYGYESSYLTLDGAMGGAFGRYPNPDQTGDNIEPRSEALYWVESNHNIQLSGAWDARQVALGGWVPSVYHFLNGDTLVGGGGAPVPANHVSALLEPIPLALDQNGLPLPSTNLTQPAGIALAADGSVYVADVYGHQIKKFHSDGTAEVIAGSGVPASTGDGGAAVGAQVEYPWDIDIDNDGNIFFNEALSNKIRKISTTGTISTVVGNGEYALPIEGARANESPVDGALSFDVLLNGELVIATQSRFVFVNSGGHIYSIRTYESILGQAPPAPPQKIAVDSSGTIYASFPGIGYLYSIRSDGSATVFAGNGQAPTLSTAIPDGVPATETPFYGAWGIVALNDGSVVFNDTANNMVRRIDRDGIVRTIVGRAGYFSDFGVGGTGIPTSVRVSYPHGLAISEDGTLFFSEQISKKIYRVRTRVSELVDGNTKIVSRDGNLVHTFNDRGLHLETRDSLTGHLLFSFVHDAEDRLIAVQDRFGNTTNIERSVGSAQIVGPFGKTTSLTIDANRFLSRFANPDGTAYSFSYGETGLLTSLLRPNGALHEFAYNEDGRLMRDSDPLGGFLQLEKLEGSLESTRVVSTTAMGLNSSYRSTHERNYFLTQRSRATVSSNGSSSNTVEDWNGLSTTQNSVGVQSTRQKLPNSRYGFAAPDIEALVRRPSGLSTSYRFKRDYGSLAFGLSHVQSTYRSRNYFYDYNFLDRSALLNTPSNRNLFYQFNELGLPIEERRIGLEPIVRQFDDLGRTTTISQSSRQMLLGYGADGLVASVTTPLSQTTSFIRDAMGRVINQILPDGRMIGFSYDASGNLASVTPPGRPAHSQMFSLLDLLAEYMPPLLGGVPQPTRYTYDLDRRLVETLRPDGKTVRNVFEAGTGRLARIESPDGNIVFTYNENNGQLLALASVDGVVTQLEYDGDLVTSVQQDALPVVEFDYNENLDVWSLGVVANSDLGQTRVYNTYGYYPDGLLYNINNQAFYDFASSGLLRGQYLDRVTETFDRNTFGEVINYRATDTSSGSVLYGMDLVRDDVGRITSKTEITAGGNVVWDYGYDASGRLVHVNRNGASWAQYQYDANSNRLSAIRSAGTESGTYDNQDRMTDYAGAQYTYSQAGDLMSKQDVSGTTSYRYDVFGNLKRVDLPDGMIVEYTVDAFNRRVAKKVNGVVTKRWLYKDQLAPIAELDASGNVVYYFIYGTKRNIPDYAVHVPTSAQYRLVTDQLGSLKMVVNTTDATISRYVEYDEFGRVLSDSNPDLMPFGFAGGMYDNQTKLTRFGARDYDAETGRWTNKDPIRFHGGDSNLYGYVLQDPVNYFDPDGLFNILVGIGGSGAAITGGEASGGIFVNPGLFGQQAAGGVFGSVGASAGLNISADVFAGIVFGGAENISGTTINQNISIGPLSFSGFFDPSTGNLVGLTVGLGQSATFAGVSTSISSTGTYEFFNRSTPNACGR